MSFSRRPQRRATNTAISLVAHGAQLPSHFLQEDNNRCSADPLLLPRSSSSSSPCSSSPTSNNNQSPGRRRRRSRRKRSTASSSWLFVVPPPVILRARDGSVRLHPRWVVGFCIFAASFLFIIHGFLYRSVVQLASLDNDNGSGVSTPRFLEEQSRSSSSTTATATTAGDNRRQFLLNRPIDWEKYTVRINTWKRREQLRVAIHHYESCPGTAEITVVWCQDQGDPPRWLVDRAEKVVISDATTTAPGITGPAVTNITTKTAAAADTNASKRNRPPSLVLEIHAINSLNERFNLLSEPPTAGILNVDDDVLRPCVALDAGFYLWTRNPDRMVGYDARGHHEAVEVIEQQEQGEEEDSSSNNSTNARSDKKKKETTTKTKKWAYSYLSTTQKSNKYSLTLTRFAFVHADYLKEYTTVMPDSIRRIVASATNAEDIAMSMWVSSRTGGRPPLLADTWAIQSLVKLYSPSAISSGHGYKKVRDDCLDKIATILGLKTGNNGRLQMATWVHSRNSRHNYFACGTIPDDWNLKNQPQPASERRAALAEMTKRWERRGGGTLSKDLVALTKNMSVEAYRRGLIQGTKPWEHRYGNNNGQNAS